MSETVKCAKPIMTRTTKIKPPDLKSNREMIMHNKCLFVEAVRLVSNFDRHLVNEFSNEASGTMLCKISSTLKE